MGAAAAPRRGVAASAQPLGLQGTAIRDHNDLMQVNELDMVVTNHGSYAFLYEFNSGGLRWTPPDWGLPPDFVGPAVFYAAGLWLGAKVGGEPRVAVADEQRFSSVVRAAFAERPNAHNFDTRLRRLAQRLGHARAIFVAVHHGDVGADKPERFPTDKETSVALPYEFALRAVSVSGNVR